MPRHFLYYAGLDRPDGIEQIGVAVSEDARTWKRPSSEPIIALGSAGDDDALQTSNPCVLVENGRFRMWYQGRGKDSVLSICYAESSDGIAWEVRPGAVLSPSRAASGYRIGFQHPHVLFDAERGLYRMWFVCQNEKESFFSHAESSDGIVWHITHERILAPKEPWERPFIYYPFVRASGSGWDLWYSARTPGRNWAICRARSSDGLSWKRDVHNPVLPHRMRSRLYQAFSNLAARMHVPALSAPYGSGSPFVQERDGVLCVTTHDPDGAHRLGITRYESRDGVEWTCTERGILSRGTSGWDAYFQADPYLVSLPADESRP